MCNVSRPATTITYLAMNEPPDRPRPDLQVEIASPFPPWYFLALYKAVGEEFYWTDRLGMPEAELHAYCADPNKSLHTLMHEGAPAGFYVLHQIDQTTELAYFGLTPSSVGKGFGGKFLDHAINTAWAREGTQKVIVETCTLDHESALPLYLSRGFVVTHHEERPALERHS